MSAVKRYVPVVVMGGTLPTVSACEDGWLIHAVDHERIVAGLQAQVEKLAVELDDLHVARDAMRCLRDTAREERDTLRAQVASLQSDANSYQSGYDKGRSDGVKHRQAEIGQLQAENARFRSAAKHATPYAWLGAAGLYRSRSDGVANGEQLLTPLYKHQEPAAQVAVPDGYRLLPVRITPQMIEGAMAAHYGARRLRQAGGPGGVDMTVNCINYNGTQAMKRMWAGALAAAPTMPAGQREIPVAVTATGQDVFSVAVGNAERAAKEVFSDSCNNTHYAIEYMVAHMCAAAPTPPAPRSQWVPVSERLPAPDEHPRVLIYTEGVDFQGEQFFDVKADQLDANSYETPEDRPEVCQHATHWSPLPIPAGETAVPEQAEPGLLAGLDA